MTTSNNTTDMLHLEINFDKPCNSVVNDPLRSGYLSLWNTKNSHANALQLRKQIQDVFQVNGQCKFKGCVSIDLNSTDSSKKDYLLNNLEDFVAGFNAEYGTYGHISSFSSPA